MKNMVRWMLMLMVVVALVSPNVQAYDLTDGLRFNMDFEANSTTMTTDSEAGLVGGVWDYNTGTPDCCNIFEATGRIGKDANFADRFDVNTAAAIADCKIVVPNSVPQDGKFFDIDGPSSWTIQTLGATTMKRTWTMWFNPMKQIQSGTFLRHAYYDSAANAAAANSWWEIRLYGGKLAFYQRNNRAGTGSSLDFATVQSVSELGIDANEWHHLAVIIDRNVAGTTADDGAESNCKIIVDGLEAPVLFNTYNGTIDANVDEVYDDGGDGFLGSPLQIGKGSSQFDGRLDEIRLYHRALKPVEVSLLYQTDGTVGPKALLPIPRSTNVSTVTDVNWVPTTDTCTSQRVWFGKDPNTWTVKQTTSGKTSTKATLAEINGGNPMDFNSVYYWRVDSNNSGYVPGPNWYFTTGTGKAYDPAPTIGEDYVDGTYKVADINMSWKGLDTVLNYSVYFSTDQALVTSGSLSVRKKVGLTVAETNLVSPERNAIVYWRVDSNYSSGMINGDIWNFRTRPYEIIFNNRPVAISYQDHTFGPNSVQVHGNSWFALRADGNSTNQTAEVNVLGKIEGTGGDRVLVFDFNTFNYDRRFDIVVVPTYRPADINASNPIMPIAIHVRYAKPGTNQGCFKFDGRMDISGQDVTLGTDSEEELRARCGGFPGPKRNSGTSSPIGSGGTASDYWTPYTITAGNYTRFGSIETDKPVFLPTALAKSTWGPGVPVNPPYKCGGGGGYGGIGGDSGRGYWAGTFSGGPSYGDEEIPVPFGGSAGGWGGTDAPGGCSGGGGIEIAADVNLTLDANSVIKANGGGSITTSGWRYPNGGGAGGSVRLIGNNVVLKGAISANGGQGGIAIPEGSSGGGENDTGGGGAGGRIAVFYTTNYSNTGTATVTGGQAGYATNTGGSFAEDGQDGTKLETSGSPEKASAPTPRDGDRMVYVAGPGSSTLTLKWYAGYGAASDEVYFSTVPNTNPANDPTKKVAGGPITTPTRGQRSAGATVSVDPNKTYYFQVKTDGTTNSDVWTFSTVDWECQYVSGATLHAKGPEWDSNGDCVLNNEDLWYFAQYWKDASRTAEETVAGNLYGPLKGDDLYRFLEFWLDCFNRTNNGCTDHLW